MNENESTDRKFPSQANIRLAIVLGLIAIMLAIMPFFYLREMVVPN